MIVPCEPSFIHISPLLYRTEHSGTVEHVHHGALHVIPFHTRPEEHTAHCTLHVHCILDSPFLAQVTQRSAILFKAFALVTVVSMRSCLMSEVTIFLEE